MSSPIRVALGTLFLLMFLGVGFQAVSFGIFALSPAQRGSSTKAVIEVRRAEGPSEIAKDLVARGAITNAKDFIWVGRFTRQWKKIKAGEYEVSPSMSPMEIFGVITSGISIGYPITVREGENIYEIAADFEAKKLASRTDILALCKDTRFIASLGLQEPLPPTLEGFLFPDTYLFNHSLSPEEMLKQMVKRFQLVWTPDYETRTKQMGMNQLQLITLASIIEKETGDPRDRGKISSVFHNRLRKKMRLQSDPTTIYGIWSTYKGNIRRSDLLSVNPYNTYTIPGLPIGPIANPGKAAIDAAFNPDTTPYLFFVSHNDGTSEFTSTLEEHNHAVRKYQLDPKARTGKSWRSLGK